MASHTPNRTRGPASSGAGSAGQGRILLIEDEPLIRQLIAAGLEREGFAVSCAASCREGMALFAAETIDLVLSDLTLPDEDGLTLIREIRARSSVPIVVLSARATIADRLSALELGADDYLTKTVDARELMLRIRRTIARGAHRAAERPATETTGPNARPSNKDAMLFDGWRVDPEGRSLWSPRGEDVRLTGSEFNILSALVRARNRVLTRDQLLDAVNDDEPPSPRMVDAYVSRIRKKMNDKRYIVTLPGFGYKFVPSPQ